MAAEVCAGIHIVQRQCAGDVARVGLEHLLGHARQRGQQLGLLGEGDVGVPGRSHHVEGAEVQRFLALDQHVPAVRGGQVAQLIGRVQAELLRLFHQVRLAAQEGEGAGHRPQAVPLHRAATSTGLGVLFQQYHLVTLFAQPIGCPQAGNAGTDDDHAHL
jgi:hypothetical protein